MNFHAAKMNMILVLLLVFISGCGSDNRSRKPLSGTHDFSDKNETIGYEMAKTGCTTGRVQFSGPDEMCSGLKNEVLNNYCASDLREEYFNKVCIIPNTPRTKLATLPLPTVDTLYLSYEFKQGCTTGKHNYNNIIQMCKDLREGSLNQNCAQDMREDYFNRVCQIDAQSL